jgi:tight adherence protein B
MPLHSLAIFLLGAGRRRTGMGVRLSDLVGRTPMEGRQASVVHSQPVARAQAAARAGIKSRREQLKTTLKEFEDRRKKSKNPPLSLRIAQAGLNLSPRQFMLISAVLGIIGLGADVGLFPAIGMSFAAALGLPR